MKGRILIVDDDEQTLKSLRRVLRGVGFDVCEAASAREADAELRQARVDAVLLDWGLPDGEGPDVVRRWRAAGVNCPVIILTGRAEVQDKEEALAAGADDYCVKPQDGRELVARLQAHIRRGSGEYLSLTAGRIEVDDIARTAKVDGAVVELTAVELHLLSLLVRRAGEVVLKQDLIQEVWKEKGHTVGSQTMYVHIARLRDKLGDAGGQIQTIHGRGWRLNLTKT